MRISVLLLTLAPAAAWSQAAPAARPDSTRRDSAARLETITVSAIRARDEAPTPAATLKLPEIERRWFGQDIPLLLQGTPSLTSYSETGNHWGYSYMRLRGVDQSRINLTIDGIPLNDPEDQVLYFADFPDLGNSIHSVQVQRGVGTSAPGTASYGGSINFQTIPVAAATPGAELQLQGGSFGSKRASAEYASGLLSSRVAVYGRASALQSTGYRRHAGTEGRSGFLGAAYVGDRHVLKLTATAGLFADTLAYVGATRAELAADRRANRLRTDEVDRFGEQVVALSYTRQLGERASLATTAYRISASGNYDVCMDADCSGANTGALLWNFNLDFRWYGATSVWTHAGNRVRTTVGVNANTYERDHHAYQRPDLANALYFNTGHKDDANTFAKASFDVGERVTLYADAQLRHARFAYAPDAAAGIAPSPISWTFFNPKAGATLDIGATAQAYVSFGINGREPARSDIFAGFDNLDTTNAAFVGPFDRVRPERVHDLEAGVRLRGGSWALNGNAFAMEFRNEILPVGQLSYIGTPLRTNVGESWRRGLETELELRPASGVEIAVNATAMRARIARFTDDATGTSYTSTEPLLSPRFTSGQRVTIGAGRAMTVTLTGQLSSRSQLDNTGSSTLTLPGAWIANAAIERAVGAHRITLHINNLTDSDRFGGGHVSAGEARYFILNPLNAFLLARLNF